MAFTAPYSTGMASSQPVAMAHRVPSARKNSSSSSVTSSHRPAAAQSGPPQGSCASTDSRKISTLPPVSRPKPAAKWEIYWVVRFTGRACISPTDRGAIR